MTINSTHAQVNGEFSQTFNELLGALVQEPFALNNGFEDLTLEEIGLILEEPFGGENNIIESYNSCKSTYCLILIELELNGYETLPDNLKNKSLKQLASFTLTTEAEAQSSIPQKISELVEERNLDLGNEDVTNLSPIIEISPVTPVNDKDELSDPAQDYFLLAEFFATTQIDDTPNISDTTKQRLVIQFAINGCEISIFNKIRDSLSSFWPERTERIQEFIRTDSFKFTEATISLFEKHEKEHGQWLYEGKFPRIATLHCLKYLTLIHAVDRLHPSVFELGCFFYFWGALSNEVHGLTNPLAEFSQLSSEELIETAFRLFRLDRIKANSHNFNKTLSEGQLQLVQEDVSRIMCVLGEWQEEQQEREVA